MARPLASRQRARRALVVAQIAASLALVVTAGLSVAGGRRLVTRPGGFDPHRLLRLEIPLPESRYGTPAARREIAAALLARLEAPATVEAVALANILPASGWSPSATLVIEDRDLPDPSNPPRAGLRVVSPGYFETMRIPLARGRSFSTVDSEDGQPVAIVSAALAERFWPGEDAVGKRLRLEDPSTGWLSVVGVVGNVTMYNWWDGEDLLAVYAPLRQAPPAGVVHAVVRTRVEPESAAREMRAAVQAADARLAVHGVRTMRDAIEEAGLGLTYLAWMMGACGATALLLSVVGIYGVVAYSVARRTPEFGVRMALGATASDVVRLAMRQAAALTAAGLAAGLVLGALVSRAMSSALLGVVSLDALTAATVSLGLGAVSLAAAYLPARRVLRLDPARILRHQ